VSSQDKAINPDLLRAQAKRANGMVTEGKWSHVPFLSQPHVVVKVIENAAKHGSEHAG